MKKIQLLPVLTTAALTTLALTGCSNIADQVQREKSLEFASVPILTEEWDQSADWLPADATQISVREAASGTGPAILAATTDAELDPAQCAETDRQSAPTYSADWAPDDVYVDRIFACGDWAVIETDSGWYGWTPNDPDEKAESPTP
ncbi:hypothetical protein [Cryobacterium luteum]|uniref:Uncharacterized protein n=1 Tax=Cryobacterium luteum TaxID=1424661 RepID=A0A1H8LBF4_9MICO|nr:hypothetical protein [Cryobacterium luteum]TFB82620.1 hypothetical protein E3O10_17170 [Cryobacterium luteum]SEO02502.1 hypothetical protein SAMN05216281_12610 [Cryobacterium luteum]